MLQITPQMKFLVAVEPVDFRKGIGTPGEAWQFQRVRFPPRKGNEPSHRESSLGLMEVTT